MSKLEFIVVLKKSIQPVWDAWTVSEQVSRWFSPEAFIEPWVDGAYELYFDPSDHKHMSTIGCKIIEMQAPKFLGFQWKGPDQFVNIMNHPEPLTHVHLEFKRIGLSTEVHVVHDGWKSGSEWNDAKAWHKKAWEGVLGELEKYLDQ